MSQKLLQVNLKSAFKSRAGDGMTQTRPTDWPDLPGLRWKVWLMNEAEHEAGGIYYLKAKPLRSRIWAGQSGGAQVQSCHQQYQRQVVRCAGKPYRNHPRSGEVGVGNCRLRYDRRGCVLAAKR